jgi:16S rRNA (guanine527-N7)-methyltransferase
MTSDPPVAHRLNELLASAGLAELDAAKGGQFQAYLDLLMRWNARLNLTAIREQEGILSRHFVESIACARALPAGIATLLDFGSGAGFPGIPIALCRPEIAVTLAESHSRKSAFLREALRTLGLRGVVHAGRAEDIKTTFDCVVLRAVDRMERAVCAAGGLLPASGWLVLMATGAQLPVLQVPAGKGFEWMEPLKLPQSEDRIIAIGRRAA